MEDYHSCHDRPIMSTLPAGFAKLILSFACLFYRSGCHRCRKMAPDTAHLQVNPQVAKRDKAAALRFFDKAMKASGIPEKVTMDKSGANKAAMDEISGRGETPIIVWQVKYLNNIVEQDHRAIKRVTSGVNQRFA